MIQRKRLLSVLLVLAMMISLLPVSARAEDVEPPEFCFEAVSGNQTTVINPCTVDGVNYLFLPSSADYAALRLKVSAGALLM